MKFECKTISPLFQDLIIKQVNKTRSKVKTGNRVPPDKKKPNQNIKEFCKICMLKINLIARDYCQRDQRIAIQIQTVIECVSIRKNKTELNMQINSGIDSMKTNIKNVHRKAVVIAPTHSHPIPNNKKLNNNFISIRWETLKILFEITDMEN